MRRFLCSCLIGLHVLAVPVQAQEYPDFIDIKPTVLGLSVDYGFLIKHSENLRELKDAYPYAIRFSWSKHLVTKKAWDFCNCFPRVGLSLAYWNFDNPNILGGGFVPMGYLEPYFNTRHKVNFFFRMGMGGAILNRPYDEETNPNNLSYSTRLSFSLMVGAGINYRLSDQMNLRLAANYNHISNGGIQVPNKGLNSPTLSLGLNRSLSPIDFPDLRRNGKRPPPEDRTRWSIAHLSGWSNAQVGERDKFYVMGFAANYSRWFGGRSAFTLGSEVVLDYSRRERIRLDGANASFPQAAFLVGHEFWLGRVTFSQQIGIYYVNAYRNSDDVYQRYGLTYHFDKRWFAGFNLKSHRHVADFFDLRVGLVL
ncbi:MAG: acyloxyacyl hydrolase [Bacteroidota bacterium]